MSKLSPDWRRKIRLAWPDEEEGWAAIAARYDRLPQYAVDVLDHMLLACGPAPIEEEKLVAELRTLARLPGAQIRMGLARLGEAGIAYPVRKAWGERWWVIPSDLYAKLMNRVYPISRNAELPPQTFEVLPLMDGNGQFRASPVPFERSFLYGLSLIARSDTALTSKGLLSKKMIDRLVTLFQAIEAPLAMFRLQTAHAGHYPLGVAMFLEAAHALGLAEIREGRLALREPELQRWLHQPRQDRLLQDWLVSRLGEAAGADAAACAAITGLRGEPSASGEGWHAENDLLLGEEARHTLRNTGVQSPDWQMQSRWPGIWLDVFYAFGWLELGMPAFGDESAGRFYRWRESHAGRHGELIIQPSGELLAGPGCGYVRRWELEQIAERRADGELTHYAITASTIAAALERGWTHSSIVRFLLGASAMANLPSALETMLEQWTSSALQFEFVQATLLRCGSPERADWLAAQSQALPYLLERVGPALFVVEAEQAGPLRKLLQQAGLPPRKGVLTSWAREEAEGGMEGRYATHLTEEEGEAGDDAVSMSTSPGMDAERSKLPGTEGLFVCDPALLRQCALAEDPVPERLHAADWESVPQMWSKQMREYHLSTRKELLQKAIALETSVRLNAGGVLRSFIPERLEQRGNDWAVTGLWGEREAGEPVRLTPDMWREMGLALPDGIPI